MNFDKSVCFQAEEDVRTCLLHLIVAVLLAGDNELIRKLTDTKGMYIFSIYCQSHKMNNVPLRLGPACSCSSSQSGPSYSKLTMSLVNDSLKFKLSDTQIC